MNRFVLAILVSSSLYADGELNSDAITVSQRAPKNVPQMQSMNMPKYHNDVFFEADFIYWVAKQEGNDYAATGTAITVPGTTDPNTSRIPGSLTAKGSVYSPDTRVNPGFKAGLGVNLSYDKWDLFLEYTFLHAKASGSVASNNINAGILPLYSYTPNNSILTDATYVATSGGTGFVSGASSSWYLHFNNLNLELGKDLEVSPKFCFRPYFGVKASWQEQQFRASYSVSGWADLAPLGVDALVFKQDFWGVGLRTGGNGYWRCWDHVGLYMNSALSALWGRFKAVGRAYDTNGVADYGNVLISDQQNVVYTLSPVLEVGAGLQLDWFVGDMRRILVQAGWEEQVWFFQNQHSTAIADTSLILQGFTATFLVDY
jgi:hypothetical protein